MPAIEWTRLTLSGDGADKLQRSSQSLVVVGDRAFIFGGEAKPRTPVDDELYVVDLKDGSVSVAPTGSQRPSARVGTALTYHPASHALYLWGGREGKAMAPCDGSLWVYDISKAEWAGRDVPAAAEGEQPEERSFHCMCVQGDELYLHAGCPTKGRLEALHSLDLSNPSASWRSLPSAPAPGRGGTVLCPVKTDTPALVRFGGFAGYELGTFDVFQPGEGRWKEIALPDAEAPAARSVHALVPLASRSEAGRETPLAVMLFGERGPAPEHLGHDGAGQFHQDAYLLLAGKDAEEYNFTPLEQSGADGVPPPRGWFAADTWGGERVVVQGGLNDQNERLSDLWIGQVKL